ncbi:hypothetical protein [Vitiosangium sp. GDMCC 1.1324]|uniref:hypothetical protein n=1 Tax=Vitiosangium sp. (strain GDMCC 1.1324) TaxID=2138576 RepID=UPI000D38EF75|nr:hypothetical protein [Vitiosangium sp. GDMCC 1.1324]PTL75246.1 hypothetical protein DAT35_55915 [Vitiosangium sp. GDMCC 1.1324]
MLRVWFFLSLLLFAPVGGGLLSSASSGDVCVQSCRDDDERGQCAPDCVDCTCCSHGRLVVVAPVASVVPMAPRPPPTAGHEEDEPPSAEVGDILRPPIVHLA